MVNWISTYFKAIPDGPIPLLDKATKTYYKGQMIVKVPLSSGGGSFYFAKTNQLEVQFIRVVSSEDQTNTPFNGYYEFINMNTFSYKRIGFKGGLINSVVSSSSKEYGSIRNLTMRSNSWLGQLFWCIGHYIAAVPAKDAAGEWTGCWVLGGAGESGTPGVNQNLNPGDAGFSIFDLTNWFLTNGPIDYNLPHGPSDPWQYYDGNAGYYDPNNPNLYIPPIEQISQIFPSINTIQNLENLTEVEPNITDNDPELIWWNSNINNININYSPIPKPSFKNIFDNYPKKSDSKEDMPVVEVCALIGGEVKSKSDNGNVSNGCALRISRALNYSGVSIPYIPQQTWKGSDGKNYFYYAQHLYNWLTKTLGPADIHKTEAEGFPNGTKFQILLLGTQNKGIYIMKPKSQTEFGASGHATLWMGIDCFGNHNYFQYASDIYIWKLN